jgi:hypothetical protein
MGVIFSFRFSYQDSYPDIYFSDVCPFPNDVDDLLTKKFW